MRLCEIGFVTPRPGYLYRFTVDPDCEGCRALDEPYEQQALGSGKPRPQPPLVTIYEVYIFDEWRENTITHRLYLDEALAQRRAHRLRLVGEDADVASADINTNRDERKET